MQIIVALRNEKGSYNLHTEPLTICLIVALRNEKGSYNDDVAQLIGAQIVALRNEKGSNPMPVPSAGHHIR